MRVGFDGRYAQGDLVGIGKHISNLIDQITKKDIECVIFYSKKPKKPIIGKNITSVILPSLNRFTFEQLNLPKALGREKVDLYHAIGNTGIPLFCPVPAVLTVHDIIPLLVGDYFKSLKYGFINSFSYLFQLKTSLFKAKKVITVSEYTKKTLVENLGVKPSKIKSIHSGAPKVSHLTDKLPQGLKPRGYILNNGGIDIRKNLSFLIRAFPKVNAQIPGLKLVITGENKKMVESLKVEAKVLGLEEAVVFPGYVEEDMLWSLIRQARCLCYPSMVEGFGGPVLEGFAAGVPVITSNTSSLPEIAGKAAYLVDPNKVEEATEAILKISQDGDLREKLVIKGRKRTKAFSWEKTAEEVVKVYEEVLND